VVGLSGRSFLLFLQLLKLGLNFSQLSLHNLKVEAAQSQIVEGYIALLDQEACGPDHTGFLHLLRKRAGRKDKNKYCKY
jgi:hypothetical protein